MNTKEWEKKVLKMFEQGTHANEVNQLIRSLLSSHTQEIREKVEKLIQLVGNPQGFGESSTWSKGRKEALTDVLQILESKE